MALTRGRVLTDVPPPEVGAVAPPGVRGRVIDRIVVEAEDRAAAIVAPAATRRAAIRAAEARSARPCAASSSGAATLR